MYCLSCHNGCELSIIGTGHDMLVEGNKCNNGLDFAEKETSNPSRVLTTTVRTKFPGVPVISVRTDGEIPKNKIKEAMHEINQLLVEDEKSCGDVILENVADTNVNIIVTSAALMQLGVELENKNVELSKYSSGGSSDVERWVSVVSPVSEVRNVSLVDDIGGDAVGGFVGAAGEAVGVEEPEEDESTEDIKNNDEERIKSRPHIKRG